MPDYIFPDNGDFSTLTEITSRARLTILSASNLRDFILGTNADPLTLSTLNEESLTILNRYASSLVVELPTVVMNAPGLIYPGKWMQIAASLPAIDWLELEQKIQKSGTLAVTPEQLEKQGRGVLGGSSLATGDLLRSLEEDESDSDTSGDAADPDIGGDY